jgi:hypothetical protein
MMAYKDMPHQEYQVFVNIALLLKYAGDMLEK